MINANATDVTSTGASNGDIDVDISGGIPPYTYQWTGPGGFHSNNLQLSLLAPGEYFLIVTDKCGNQATERVIVCDVIQIDGEVDASCMGITDNEIVENEGFDVCWGLGYIGGRNSNGQPKPIDIQGGTGPYAYLWKHESDEDWYAITSNGQSMQPYHDHACEGETSILVIDQLGCRSETTFTLTASSDGSNDYEERIEDIFVAPYGAISSVPSQCQNYYSIDVTERLFCRRRYYCTSTGRLLDVDVRKITVIQNPDPNSEQCDLVLYCDGEVIDESLYHFTSDDICTVNTECGDVVYCVTRLFVGGRYMGHVYRIGEETTFELEESYEVGTNFDGSQTCVKVFKCPLSGEVVRRIYDANTQPEYRTIFVGTEPPFLRCDLCTLCDEEEVERYEVPLEVCYQIKDKNPVVRPIDDCDEDDKLGITSFSVNGFSDQSIYKTNNTETFSLSNLSFDNEYLGGKTEFGIEATDRTYTEIKSKNIDTDAHNVFTTGYFTESESNTGQDIFVQKYYHNSEIAWTRQFMGSGDDVANDVSVGKSDKTYVTGYFNQEIELGLNTLNSESQDIFVSKLYSNGYPEWSKQAGGSGIDEALSIDVDNFGNIFTTGYITGPATFDEYTTNTPDGKQSMFLAKYRADGVAEWVKTGVLDANVDFENSMLVTDSEGNVIVAGDYTGDFTLEGLTTPLRAGSSLGKAAFIAKYSPSGQVLWAERVGKSNGMNLTSIVIDEQDNVTVAGVFTGTGDFTNASEGDLLVSEQASKDIFFAKFDKNGRIFWLKQAGAENDEVIHDLTTDGVGRFAYVATATGTTTLEGDTYEAADGAENCVTTDFACDASIEAQITNASCDENNGAIDLTVTATERANVTFTYKWSYNDQTTEDLSGLEESTYTVTVSDGEDCAFTRDYEVERLPSFELTPTAYAASCSMDNGYITLDVTGGFPPYSYAWSTGASSKHISALAPDTYTVSVTDALGCSKSYDVLIEDTPEPQLTANITNAVCGRVDGAIVLNASGGRAPYSFLWSNGATTKDIAEAPAGTYSVTLTDADNCSKNISVEVVEDNLETFVIVSDADCDPFSSSPSYGSITVQVLNSNASSYSYDWERTDIPNGATGDGFSIDHNIRIGSLESGDYSITITSNGGAYPVGLSGNESFVSCKKVIQIHVGSSFGGGPIIQGSPTATPTSCGQDNGTATVNVAGGTTPYSYKWSNGATTQSTNGLSVGSYRVTVTAANGCTDAAEVEIEQNPTLNLTVNTTDASCNTCADGTANVSASNGTAPYQYHWSNGPTTANTSNLLPGTYEVTVTDKNGCEQVGVATIGYEVACDLSVTYLATTSSCGSCADASIEVTPGGGTAPYTYQWSNGATTSSIDQIMPDTYSVVVTDAGACQITVIIEVLPPEACNLAATFTVHDVTTPNDPDGSISTYTYNGAVPYTYEWSNGSTSSNLTDLIAGEYHLTLSDANGCIANYTVMIEQLDCDIQIDIVSQSPTCHDILVGSSLAASASGGIPPYEYVWTEPGSRIYNFVLEDFIFTRNIVSTDSVLNYASPNVTYEVEVTDAQGCKSKKEGLVENPSGNALAVSIAVDQSDICTRIYNATAHISGGVPPYEYDWYVVSASGTWQAVNAEDPYGLDYGSVAADGLSATLYKGMEYRVSVKDASGCRAEENLYLEPIPLSCFPDDPDTVGSDSTACATIEITSDVNPCSNEVNGTLTAEVEGIGLYNFFSGKLEYTLEWSTGETTSSIFVTEAGVYTVTVRAAIGSCEATTSFNVGAQEGLQVDVSTTDASSPSSNDGSASAAVAGGTTPYTYNWSNGSTDSSINGLSSGTYGVTVTDANNCSGSGSGIVNDGVCNINLSFSGMKPSCYDYSDGLVGVSASGNGSSYSYIWSNGSTAAEISNLKTGTYSVTATNDLGCSKSGSFTLSQPDPISISFTTTHVSTNGGSDGEITADASGGTYPYTYEWEYGSTSATIGNLKAGTYTVTVTDSKGCKRTSTATVNGVNCNNPITITPSLQEPLCHGEENGSISVVVAGGKEPYTYQWSEVGETSAGISNIGSGQYNITVKDAALCSATLDINLGQPEPINISTSSTNTDCSNCGGGTASVSVRGGTSPYTYKWSTGATASGIENLTAGTYGVTITDANSCTAETSVSVSDSPCEISVSPSSTAVSCPGGSDGSASVSVSGNGTGYTYNWSNGSTGPSISGLTAGSYVVTITTTNDPNCRRINFIDVKEPDPMTVSFETSHVTTSGGSDGSITASASGGTSPYTYDWETEGSGATIEGLAAGSYKVIVTDALGCTKTATATVNGINCDRLKLTYAAVNPKCHNEQNGSISLSAAGGEAPYKYTWNDGSTAATRNNLGADTYGVTLTDNRSCTKQRTIVLGQPNPLNLNMSKTDLAIVGGSDGTASVSASGGTSPYTYNWNTGASTTSIGNLMKGDYTVTVIDANGCSKIGNVTINNPPCSQNSMFLSMTSSNVTCNGGQDGKAGVIVDGGVGPYTYIWNNGANTTDIVDLESGNYSVKVVDEGNCSFSSTGSVNIYEPFKLSLSLISTPASCGQDNGSVQASVFGGTKPYKYTWSTNSNHSGNNSSISGLSEGSYSVSVTDANNCPMVSSSTTVGKDNLKGGISVKCDEDKDDLAVLCAENLSGGSGQYNYEWKHNGSILGNSKCIDYKINDQNSVSLTVIDANNVSCSRQWNIVPNCSSLPSNTNIDNSEDAEMEDRNSVDVSSISSIKVYPNPFNNYLNIDISTTQAQALDIYLYDLMGRLLYRESIEAEVGINQTQIDLSAKAVASGVYQVVVRGKEMNPQNFKVVRVE